MGFAVTRVTKPSAVVRLHSFCCLCIFLIIFFIFQLRFIYGIILGSGIQHGN